MKLYFRPLACSMSSRITLYETGLVAELVEVDRESRRATDGVDFLTVNPLGMVPVLILDDGGVLTENPAILEYLAGLAPDRKLVPTDETGRMRLREWLSFIGSELHQNYVPLLDKTAPADAKAYVQKKLEPRLAHVAAHLASRSFLLGELSVADAYLFAVLNWTQVTPIALAQWPPLTAFMSRMLDRPAVQRAFGEERERYLATHH
jgi:glutathione S-transferase